MKALVFGGGGREHALAARLAREGWEVAVAPGNAGIAPPLTCHPLDLGDVEAAVALARALSVDLALVGPEAPLIAGLGDGLRAAGVCAFAPSAAAAQVEGSKAFAKQLMAEAGVPTARSAVCVEAADARAFARALDGRVVVKADGLAGGKGVVVAQTLAEADAAIHAFLERGTLGAAGRRLVLEELLEGPEVSLMAVCQGRRASPLPLAHDYKRLLAGDRGPNTGGMGSVAPSARASAGALEALTDLAIRPALAALDRRGAPFTGTLYAGLMLTAEGPKVLEYNCRFGDPETQALLWACQGSLGELLRAAAGGGELFSLAAGGLSAVAVVAATRGYPQAPEVGDAILGLEAAEARCAGVYLAGVARSANGALCTAGGRVLATVGVGSEVAAARQQAYAALEQIHFEGQQARRDIGGAAPG